MWIKAFFYKLLNTILNSVMGSGLFWGILMKSWINRILNFVMAANRTKKSHQKNDLDNRVNTLKYKWFCMKDLTTHRFSDIIFLKLVSFTNHFFSSIPYQGIELYNFMPRTVGVTIIEQRYNRYISILS